MIKKSHYKLRCLIIFGLTALSVFYIFPPKQKINLGLDLKGGMYVLLRADTSSLHKDKIADALSAAVEKIRNRIDEFGVKETSIQLQGENSILIQVPGIVDRTIVDRLKEVGKLEFKVVEEDEVKKKAALEGNVPQGYELRKHKETSLLLYKEAAITGSDLEESFTGFDQYGRAVVNLRFNGAGAKKFAKVTEQNVGKLLAIVLDDKIMSAPQIREPIMNGQAEITGDFTLDESRMLVSVLNSGALPIPLIVEEERTVGPLLGSDSIKRGINSTILGGSLVFIFMLVYYLLGGVVASICLFLNLAFTLAGLHLFGATLTLPGIAGMILTLGMAVDANVLIYERIRDELALKKPLNIAVRNSFDRTILTIFDANVTTLIAAVFLFIFGSGPIRGFATTLSLGLIISMFTAIFVSRTILGFLLERKLNKFPMLQFFPSANIDFLKIRNFFLVGSSLIIIIGMVSFFGRKDSIYGVDFKGGQVMEYKLTPSPKIEDVRKILKEQGFSDLAIQDFKDIEGGIIIKSKEDVAQKVESILKNNFKEVEKLKINVVGPVVGKILKRQAVLAVLLSLMGILIYVFLRFKHFDFALAGVIALLHDVLISLGFIALFGYEVDLLIITALLTIAGYSINDTIVIYDRIRELSPQFTKLSLKDLMNKALNSTFSRTIITSFTVLLVTLAMYIAGGETLRGFSFALLVGFLSGVYSTIYIASSLVLLFRKSSV